MFCVWILELLEFLKFLPWLPHRHGAETLPLIPSPESLFSVKQDRPVVDHLTHSDVVRINELKFIKCLPLLRGDK